MSCEKKLFWQKVKKIKMLPSGRKKIKRLQNFSKKRLFSKSMTVTAPENLVLFINSQLSLKIGAFN